jgi:hypothetical protein
MDKKKILIFVSAIIIIFAVFYFNKGCYRSYGTDLNTGLPTEVWGCEILYIPMAITMIVFSAAFFGFNYFAEKKK